MFNFDKSSLKTNLYLEVHIIQTLPFDVLQVVNPSLGSALYGGTPRLYVPSQIWRKAMCDYYKDTFKEAWEQENRNAQDDTKMPGIGRVLFGKLAANEPHRKYRLPRFGVPCMSYAIATHAYCGDKVDPVVYRYGSLSIDELSENLNLREIRTAAIRFIKSFANVLPNGKSGSNPELIYVIIRKRHPVSFETVFEKPIRVSGQGDYCKESISVFNQDTQYYYDNMIAKPEYAWYIGNIETETLGIKKNTFSEVLPEVDTVLGEIIS